MKLRHLLGATALVAVAYLKGRIDAAAGPSCDIPEAADPSELQVPSRPARHAVRRVLSGFAATLVSSTSADGDPAYDEVRPGWRATHMDPAGGPVAVESDGSSTDDETTAGPETSAGDEAGPGMVSEHIARNTLHTEQNDCAGETVTVEGEFSIAGLAHHRGDLAFGRVTFPERLAAAPAVDAVEITIDTQENLPEHSLSVMDKGGFAPCTDGMTLVAAASGPGRFSAQGRYAIRVPTAHATAESCRSPEVTTVDRTTADDKPHNA